MKIFLIIAIFISIIAILYCIKLKVTLGLVKCEINYLVRHIKKNPATKNTKKDCIAELTRIIEIIED